MADVAKDMTGASDAVLIPADRALVPDQETTNDQASALTGLPSNLPDDLIIYMAAFLEWLELLHTAHVCRRWRHAIVHYAPLWARLDLYDTGHQALRILPQLLPLSGNAPLNVRVWFFNDDEYSNNIGLLCSHLGPHLYRLRALTVRSRRRSNYAPLFTLLQRDAPILSHLDVSDDHREYVVFDPRPPIPPNAILALAPNLSFVNWGSHLLPEAPSRLFRMTNVRIDVPSTGIGQIFSLLPCVTRLCIDGFTSSRGVQALPHDHPLTSLTLNVRHIEESPYIFSWDHVQSRGFGRIALLRLCQYSATAVIYACRDPDWQLRSLTIDYDDFVHASITRRDSRSECRMTDLAPSRGKTWGMVRLMSETDWLRALVSLTVSMALSVEQTRPMLLLPRGRLPALLEFSLLCGTQGLKSDGKVERWGSLLDADILATCGVLDAPQLRVVRLVSRTPRPSGADAVIPPASLARFISCHVRVDAVRVPLLKISMHLRLEDDAAGLAALRTAADLIEHWL